MTRSHYLSLPRFYAKYAGDALWAVMVFLLAGWLAPRRPVFAVAGIAFAFSCAIEFSQMYHAGWIDALRHTVLGHLVLGDTFAWADIGAYLVGITGAALIEKLAYAKHIPRPDQENGCAD